MSALTPFLHTHWQAALYFLGAWFAIGNAVGTKWPIPPTSAPAWKRAAHFLLVNIPAYGRKLQGRTIYGFTFAIPFLSFTVRPDDTTGALPPPSRPTNGQSGRASLVLLMVIGIIGLCCAIAMAGCATVCSDMSNPTCARKVLTGIDALDGAASRIGAMWVQKCGDAAKALDTAGKTAEADAAFTKCEQTGAILVLSVKEVEDGATAADAGVDVGEKIGSKDYSGALAPAIAAARALYKNFTDAGLSLPAIDSLLGVH